MLQKPYADLIQEGTPLPGLTGLLNFAPTLQDLHASMVDIRSQMDGMISQMDRTIARMDGMISLLDQSSSISTTKTKVWSGVVWSCTMLGTI